MESRRNGPQLSSRHDDDDDLYFVARRMSKQVRIVGYLHLPFIARPS